MTATRHPISAKYTAPPKSSSGPKKFSGWLVYDYRSSNPIFRQIIEASGHVTRPCYFFLPASGLPRLLVHHVDAGKFTASGVDLAVYLEPRQHGGVPERVSFRGTAGCHGVLSP